MEQYSRGRSWPIDFNVCDRGQRRPAGEEILKHWRRQGTSSQGATLPHASVATGVRSPKLARLEAALFVAEGALSARKLMQHATLADTTETLALISQLNHEYDNSGSSFRVERVSSGYRLMTRPIYTRWLDRLHSRKPDWKLSPPVLETLTLVAYRQPITRADIEAIRGVQCADTLKHLMDAGLVRIGGEEDSLGRPYLYETTKKFLEVFGLQSLDDLPEAVSLRRFPDRATATPAGNRPSYSTVDDADSEEGTGEVA